MTRKLAEDEAKARLAELRKKAMLASLDAAVRDGPVSGNQVSFFIRSQMLCPRDQLLASRLKQAFRKAEVSQSQQIFMHELDARLYRHGAWTVSWFVREWLRRDDGRSQWFVVLEPWTDVDVTRLNKFLAAPTFNAADEWFLGHGLHMAPSVITLNFDEHLVYPFADSGFALNRPALERLSESLEADPLGMQFHVTWTHEFAWLVKSRLGLLLKSLPEFLCARDRRTQRGPWPARCVTRALDKYAFERSQQMRSVGRPLQDRDVIIAVKTTGKFHHERLRILQATWATPGRAVFLSDREDETVPTVDLRREWGQEIDQDRGHCAKTHAILKHLDKYYPDRLVYVIVDDDTTLSIPRLYRMLDSYRLDQDLYLGQRYAYGYTAHGGGADYITMGGGVALSRTTLKKFLASGLQCSAPDTFDDMQMGRWMRSLSTAAVHDDRFHQAQPQEYNEFELGQHALASFHKFRKKRVRRGVFAVDFGLNVERYQSLMETPRDPDAEFASTHEEL